MSPGVDRWKYSLDIDSSFLKSLLLMWRSGFGRFHLRKLDLQMGCSDLTKWEGSGSVVPVTAASPTYPIVTTCSAVWLYHSFTTGRKLVVWNNKCRGAKITTAIRSSEEATKMAQWDMMWVCADKNFQMVVPVIFICNLRWIVTKCIIIIPIFIMTILIIIINVR